MFCVFRRIGDGIGTVGHYSRSLSDEWDAQKDILCDTFGAISSASLFLFYSKRRMYLQA